MAETTFDIAYKGPALETGRMPVRDLAPALLAVGDLFALSSGILYPELKPVAVKVEGTKEGSFYVRLLLDAEDAWDHVVKLFGSKDASALTNLKELIVAGGFGLFWLIKRIAGRKVASAQHDQPQPGIVRLTLDDQTTLDVPSDVWVLYRDIEVRKHTRQVVEPLAREGVEAVTFTADAEREPLTVEKEELEAFAVVDEDEEPPLNEQEQELYVEVVSPTFKSDNKWRLSFGDHVFFAAMEDADFLHRVESGERFGKGDVLRCRIETTQRRDAEGLHTVHRVMEVLQHLPRATQLRLDD